MMLGQILGINRLEFSSNLYFQSDYVTAENGYNKNTLHQSMNAMSAPPPPKKSPSRSYSSPNSSCPVQPLLFSGGSSTVELEVECLAH